MRYATALLTKPTVTVAPIALMFCAAVLSVLTVDPGQLVEERFKAALSDHNATEVPVAVAAARANTGGPVAGSEAYWLGTPDTHHSSIANAVQPVVWAPPVAIGDRVRLSDASGTAKTLEVVRIEPLHRTATGNTKPASAETNSNATLWLVSCRDPADPETSIIRMIVDENTNLPWLRQARNQAL